MRLRLCVVRAGAGEWAVHPEYIAARDARHSPRSQRCNTRIRALSDRIGHFRSRPRSCSRVRIPRPARRAGGGTGAVLEFRDDRDDAAADRARMAADQFRAGPAQSEPRLVDVVRHDQSALGREHRAGEHRPNALFRYVRVRTAVPARAFRRRHPILTSRFVGAASMHYAVNLGSPAACQIVIFSSPRSAPTSSGRQPAISQPQSQAPSPTSAAASRPADRRRP